MKKILEIVLYIMLRITFIIITIIFYYIYTIMTRVEHYNITAHNWEVYSVYLWSILKLFWTYNDWINILVFTHWSIIRSIIIYIIFNWKISPWEYFRLTEILKIKSCWISEIIYSKEKFEKIYTWKIKDFMNSNNIIY